MFVLNDDLSIYATRGDIVFFTVSAEEDGVPYVFKVGDVVRIKVYGKKDASSVVLEKDFPVTADTESVEIYLSKEDTKIGAVISKPKDYWYEIELNPLTHPQTIIGYDDDGAKIFKLFPEGADLAAYVPQPEDIPFIDNELDLTSQRPVENQAVARAIVQLNTAFEKTKEETAKKGDDTAAVAKNAQDAVAVERARIDNLVTGNGGSITNSLAYLESVSAETKTKIDATLTSDGVNATLTVNFREANLFVGGTSVEMFVIPNNCRPMATGKIGEYNGVELEIRYDTTKGRYTLALKVNSGVMTAPYQAGTARVLYALDNYELKDIRVGRGGTVYATAGEAVRTGFGLSNRAFEKMCERGETTFAPYVGFTRGGLANGVISPYYKCRVPSVAPISFNRNITLKIKSGFRVGVQVFDGSGNFSVDQGWRTGEYTIEAGTEFMVVIARSATIEDNTEVADFDEFVNAVTFDTATKSEIEILDLAIERNGTVVDHVATRKNVEIKGAYHTTGGAGHTNNRIHAADFACDGLAVITFVGDTEMLYGVDLYTNDGKRTKISESGWTRTSDKPVYIVEQPCLIDLSISKTTGLSFDSLTEMDGLFDVKLYDTLGGMRGELNSVKDELGGVKNDIANSKTKRKKTWISSAHQGFCDDRLRPNSLAAYYNAYLHGADMIETDARLSKDGVLVVCHDPTVTGTNDNGDPVTYTIAETPASDICSLILTRDDKWGVQRVPTLEQVLNLAYHTGMIANIDMKNGLEAVDKIVDLVAKCGMLGRVIYAPNGTGAISIGKILEKDPDARFIDVPSIANHVANNPALVGKCYAFTADVTKADEIRASGCLVALISLNASNFKAAIAQHPDMCEYLHNSDFRAIEDAYFDDLKLY